MSRDRLINAWKTDTLLKVGVAHYGTAYRYRFDTLIQRLPRAHARAAACGARCTMLNRLEIQYGHALDRISSKALSQTNFKHQQTFQIRDVISYLMHDPYACI